MTVLAKITLAAALLLSIAVPFGAFAAGEKTKGRYKTAIGVNVFLFIATIGVAAGLMFTGHAFAAEETAKAVNSAAGWGYLAAALSTGMSCLGGGIAVSAEPCSSPSAYSLAALHSQPSPQLQLAASPPVWATSQLLFPPDFPVSAAALPFPRQHPQHLALSVRIPPFLVNLLSS